MTSIVLAILIAAAGAPSACFDNLCADYNEMTGMQELHCVCHKVGGKDWCWTRKTDCDVDRVCCEESGKCNGMVQDACTAATAKHRKMIDAPKKAATKQ